MNWGRHAPPTAPDLQPWLQAWLAAPGAPAPEAVDLRPNDRALLAAVAAAAGPVLEDWRAELHRLRREATTLRTVLDHVETAILAIRRDHHRLYANPAAERLWALGPEPAGRVTSLARLPELMAGLEEVAGGGPAWRRRLLLPDERSWEVAVTPLDTQGGCVLVARDVSEGVRLETVRRDFVAALSHELRTPLTSIQGYAELLQQPDLAPADRAEYLDVIVQNTERLNRLAQDLVLLSSLETGAYQFRFERLPADSLAAPALAVMAPLARELHCQPAGVGLRRPRRPAPRAAQPAGKRHGAWPRPGRARPPAQGFAQRARRGPRLRLARARQRARHRRRRPGAGV